MIREPGRLARNGPASEWEISRNITTSDNNYDFGELWMISPRTTGGLVAPTETGPQPYNPGGEIAMWASTDHGATWKQTRQMTSGSAMNHTYVRRALNAHPDFIGIWADGHGRQPSDSRIYFADLKGNVFQLPVEMESTTAAPIMIQNR